MWKFIRDWRTTIFGTAGAGAAAVAIGSDKFQRVASILMVIFQALWAWYTKDKQVTGGTVPATKEAEARTTPSAAEPSKK